MNTIPHGTPGIISRCSGCGLEEEFGAWARGRVSWGCPTCLQVNVREILPAQGVAFEARPHVHEFYCPPEPDKFLLGFGWRRGVDATAQKRARPFDFTDTLAIVRLS